MANNRIYATCHNPEHGEPKSRMLAKFYPSTGWYEPEISAQAWQQFLQEHNQCGSGMWGNQYIRITYEIPPDSDSADLKRDP